MIKNIKEKIVGSMGSLSGAASILGSWQVCHNACLALIAALSIIGITISGMPLLFLTKIVVPIWAVAVILLLVTIAIYMKKKCISKNLIILNSGLIIAGIPFQPLQKFSVFFWAIGGILALAGISLFIKEKMQKRSKHGKKQKNSSSKIMYFVMLVLIVIVGCTNNSQSDVQSADKNTGKKDANIAPIAAFKTISTGSLDSGDASVDLTPTGMKNGKFEVDVSINTHSVDLGQFDLMKMALLEYDGKTIKPLSAPKLSGHHNSGTLIFDTGMEIKNFKIIIMGIPAVEERVFEWN